MPSCIYPLEIKNPETGLRSQVRCGRCRSCRINRRDQWIGRLRLEMLDHEVGRFLTLTYKDDPGVLDGAHLSSFMKRYRWHYGPCRFFGIGEYGEKNARGHWHVLIFGHAPEVRGPWLANKAWDLGYSFDGLCNLATIRYTAAYTLKLTDDREHRPVLRTSLRPGIGMTRIARLAVLAAREGVDQWPSSYRVGGTRYPLCDGGLARFQTEYLDAGGKPPIVHSPESRDARVSAWHREGTRIEAEERSKIISFREVCDVWAAPKAKRS